MATYIQLTCLILVIATNLIYAIPPFVNNFGQNTMFNCPAQQTVSGIYSRYSWSPKDRRYSFTCQTVTATPYYQMLSNFQYVPLVFGVMLIPTNYNQNFNRYCYQSGWGVMTNVHSYYSATNNDRSFGFGCKFFGQTGVTNYKKSSYEFCEWKVINWYRDAFAFDLPFDKYIFAIKSQFHSAYRDRQFQAYICPVVVV